MTKIYDVVIGGAQQRMRLDGLQMIVKIEAVYDSDNNLVDNVPGILKNVPEISYEDADALMATDEWNDNTTP